MVQALRQTGAHCRRSLRIGNDTPIHLDPLYGAKQLPLDKRTILCVRDKPGGISLSVKADENTAHVEHDIFYHAMETFLLAALNPTISRMPLAMVRNFP